MTYRAAASSTSRAHDDDGLPSAFAVRSMAVRSASVSRILSGRSVFGVPEIALRPIRSPSPRKLWLRY
jgi:hypothetical protein